MAGEKFDLVLHLGDFCGGTNGARAVRTTLRMMRRIFEPGIAIVATTGNHDLWREPDHIPGKGRRGTRPGAETFARNLEEIQEAMTESGVHFLDLDGPWRSDHLPGLAIVGCMGWYAAGSPATNDFNFLPIGLEGDTHRYLQRLAQQSLYHNLDKLGPGDLHIIFASHFPVVEDPTDFVPLETWGWSRGVGEMLTEQHRVRIFINGHSHRLCEGPTRFECGPDYGKPAYRVWEFDFG